MASTCPHCGNPVKPGIKFCGSCGKPIPATPLAVRPQHAQAAAPPVTAVGSNCPNCGKPVRAGAKFCANCGKPVQAGDIKLVAPVSPVQAPISRPLPTRPAAQATPRKKRAWLWLFLGLAIVCSLVVAAGVLYMANQRGWLHLWGPLATQTTTPIPVSPSQTPMPASQTPAPPPPVTITAPLSTSSATMTPVVPLPSLTQTPTPITPTITETPTKTYTPTRTKHEKETPSWWGP
jgi:hypothetical protein